MTRPTVRRSGWRSGWPNCAASTAVLGLALLAAPQEAAAQDKASELMPPSTRPGFLVLGVGPSAFGLNLGGGKKPKGFDKNFKLGARGKAALDFGWHLDGAAEGAALGATIEQTVDGKGLYVFNPGFKFWWDIHVTDMGIYITPQAKAGYAMGTCKDCGFAHAFNFAIGAEGRVVFKDRWMTFLRPIYLDAYFGDFFDEPLVLGYDILLGGGVTF
ncbi:MAG: hypothetical protein JRI68_19085 [Deltaproteobacteria bacterium]|nr:hypothetical protein [Deltaproteobacteria bacterium]